jgi:septin family protein
VIGPYRSGKSFLLNQLLSLSCYEGFGVGHMRDTKTKGIWVWGTPLELEIDGVKTSVIYLDTEGFESVGKSNVYDDRYPDSCNICTFKLFFAEALNI